MIGESGGVHATGDVDGVAPDVVLGLAGADDAGDDGSDVHADADGEVVVRVLVDAEQLLFHGEDELDERGQVEGGGGVGVVVADAHLRHETDGRHVRRAHRFDLVDRPESVLA